MKPFVAIVGRANVGKSRLFNRMVGRAQAIVHDRPGITRDRHYAPADWRGREYIAIDTGGMEPDAAAELGRKVTRQSLAAVAEADVVVCVMDGQCEPTAEDDDIVRLLRERGANIVGALNKIDMRGHESCFPSFARLGLDPLIMVSAEHGRGVDDLLDAVIERFPAAATVESPEREGLRVSVVGRPNVGKSTLINRLAGSDRVVAHELPGTTRDAIDVEISFEGKDYVFVDTAGVKRAWKQSEQIERFVAMRSLRSIERSQIVLLMVDASAGLGRHDQALTGFIIEEGKGLILVMNKWDLVREEWSSFEKKVRSQLGRFHDVSVIGISAQNGYHCLKVFESIDRVNRALARRLSTSSVNRVIERALAEHHLPVYRGREVRIYYGTQSGTYPPTFTLFVNRVEGMTEAYRRYLVHRFQEALGSSEAPVRLVVRKKT